MKMKNIAETSERDFRVATWIYRGYIRTTVVVELHLPSSVRNMTTCG
jgi:hypothetical protein